MRFFFLKKTLFRAHHLQKSSDDFNFTHKTKTSEILKRPKH